MTEKTISEIITKYFILKKGWLRKKRYRKIIFDEDDSECLAKIIICAFRQEDKVIEDEIKKDMVSKGFMLKEDSSNAT